MLNTLFHTLTGHLNNTPKYENTKHVASI